LIYQFENYSFDVNRQELRRGPELVPIEPQVLDLLHYLIRNRERVVSKDDLIANVWNGRIVSESTLTSRITSARQAIGDSGSDQRLIRTIARKGIRFVGEVQENLGSTDASTTKPVPPVGRDTTPVLSPAVAAPQLPDKPSIAVLPFNNLSGDPEQEYFADGVVDDIITALSYFRWLFVIARNSSFTYKGRAVDVMQVGRELGVRYVLEGSVRKAENHVRIVAQLIDATTGAHISADRFDGELKDIFDLQEKVAASVAGAIAPKLERTEMERARRKPTENLDAYDYFMRATANIYQWTGDGNDEALRLLQRAIELDPNFASAYGLATHCYCFRKSYGPWENGEQAIAQTARLARRAVELGKDDAFALCWAGYSLAYVVRELDDGAAFIDRALALNPNLARAWNHSGWVRIWLGEPEIAVDHLARAMRLSPLDPGFHRMQSATASAHFFAGRYDEASSWAEKALREQPKDLDVIGMLAMSNALAGQLEKAKYAMARLVQLSPERRLSNINTRIAPYRRPEDRTKIVEAARKAGLPE
jgi:TolB-like protein/tetratricopeptide (TPR) repeat protein